MLVKISNQNDLLAVRRFKERMNDVCTSFNVMPLIWEEGEDKSDVYKMEHYIKRLGERIDMIEKEGMYPVYISIDCYL